VECKNKKDVITGTGIVSALGLGTENTVRALKNKNRGLSKITGLNLNNMKSQLAGFVPEFRASDVDRRLDLSGMNKISSIATAASSLALENAGLRVNRRNAGDFGIVMGVCNGPNEMEHMDSVFSSDNYTSDLNSFSNITANSTAGWVSNALCLKGVSMTLSPGPHAGLQSLAYAYDFLSDGRAKSILAGAADEVYAQAYFNYNLLNFLFQGEDETDYKINLSSKKRKVLGEGSAVIVTETLESAQERNARILAEITGYGMSMDAGSFSEQNLGSEGLEHACKTAMERSGIEPDNINLIVWAPQGNIQDKKVLDALQNVLGQHYNNVPFGATTFNTGFIESATILTTLGATLESLNNDNTLWPQITGLPELDERELTKIPEYILALGSTDIGYNFAVVLRNGKMI
jgi:3-oxoacyl-[acyl-carrier-protein] synthase II